jgi:Flp pilus assembly protein TadD
MLDVGVEATMMNKQLWFVLVFAACGTEERTPVSRTTNPAIPPAPIAIAPPPPLAIAAPAPKVPTQYGEAMEDAKAALASGDSVHARDLLSSAVLLDKQQADPHVELARIAIAGKEKALAVKEARLATKLAPDSSRAWNTLGRAELARWQYQGAHDAFAKAAELDPDSAWAWNNLGFTELSFKSYRAAADALVVAVSKPGATGYMWNNLGTAYEQLDLIDEARDAFEHGGKLGSRESVASRKRLEGVAPMIAKVPAEPPATDYPHDETPASDTATQ